MASIQDLDTPLVEEDKFPPEGTSPDRVIVLFGGTGVGKSTVGNVLAGRPNLFAESSDTKSETKGINSKLVYVRHRGEQRYVLKIIDSMGLGDTESGDHDISTLYQLARLVTGCKGGIHQILFITESRFTDVQRECFELMQRVIFTEDVLRFTCVVRTFSEHFEESSQEVKVRDDLREQSDMMKKINRFILVNCPPTTREKTRELHEEDRRLSRVKLLDHIILGCKEIFNPGDLKDANARVGAYVQSESKLQREVDEAKQEIEKLKKEIAEKQQSADCSIAALTTEMSDLRADLASKMDMRSEEREEASAQLAAALVESQQLQIFVKKEQARSEEEIKRLQAEADQATEKNDSGDESS
eukprot:scpid61525/ scgid20111/ 